MPAGVSGVEEQGRGSEAADKAAGSCLDSCPERLPGKAK